MWNNVTAWLSGSTRDRERSDTHSAWEETEAQWRECPAAADSLTGLVLDIVNPALAGLDRKPAIPITVELCLTVEALVRLEDITAIEPIWERIEGDMRVAVAFREMLGRRRRWTSNFAKMLGIFATSIRRGIEHVTRHLPLTCFDEWTTDNDALGVPLVEMVEHPALLVEGLVLFAYDDDTLGLDVFRGLREQLERNLLTASGYLPTDDIHERQRQGKLIVPTRQKDKSAAELARLYLADTPFESLMELPVPFSVPPDARFEHAHIIGGTGHGKTQLMQRLIHADLLQAQESNRSLIVIDSQGDLIRKLSRLALFDPDTPDSLADRLILIDPTDVEFPASLNLFDAHLDRVASYRPVDQERVLNGVIELYEVFFGAMLGAELTQKQGVIFRYLARLMMAIPDATIYTLMELMQDGAAYGEHMARLEGSARYFFETEFFHPSFSATKKQILKRLWGVLSTPAFERMFAQKRNKLDLFEAMNGGKIVLISTAKDVLKTEGSALFGRFFVALIAQAALERSTLPEGERPPCFVYIDEAQEYFDDSIETILTQARKYQVGLTLAHQSLDQLSPGLRSSILANTSFKCAGGVSAKDARALSDELRTQPEFIGSMRRGRERTEFAVWLKHHTPHAIRVSVPLGHLERQPLLTEEALADLLTRNRTRYCGTKADVLDFAPAKARQGAPWMPRERSEEPPPRVRETREEPAVAEPTATAPEPEVPPASGHKPPRAREPGASPAPPKELGKGGPQHRYAQHLVKELAEARGFRAVIEEPTEGGLIDVALHRPGLSIACEISVTSKADREAAHLAKCLRGPYARVFAIATDKRRLKNIESAAHENLSEDELARVDFLVPDQLATALDLHAAPQEETAMIRGYRVKVSRTPVSTNEAEDRRATIGRVIAQSIRDLKKPE